MESECLCSRVVSRKCQNWDLHIRENNARIGLHRRSMESMVECDQRQSVLYPSVILMTTNLFWPKCAYPMHSTTYLRSTGLITFTQQPILDQSKNELNHTDTMVLMTSSGMVTNIHHCMRFPHLTKIMVL